VAFLLTQITDFTFTQGLIISWVSYTAFTMYSGTRGVILTDTLMFLLFTSVAILALIFLVQDAGGWAESVRALATLPEQEVSTRKLRFTRYAPLALAVYSVTMVFSYFRDLSIM